MAGNCRAKEIAEDEVTDMVFSDSDEPIPRRVGRPRGSTRGRSRGRRRGAVSRMTRSIGRTRSEADLNNERVLLDSSEDLSNVPDAYTEMDLNFVAIQWSKCLHKNHSGMNLRLLAESYVKFFMDNDALVEDWGNCFTACEPGRARNEKENTEKRLYEEYLKLEDVAVESVDVQNEVQVFNDTLEENPGISRAAKLGNEAAVAEVQLKSQHVKKPKTNCISYLNSAERGKITAALCYKLYESFEDCEYAFPPKLLELAKHELHGPNRQIWEKKLVLPERFRDKFPNADRENEDNAKAIYAEIYGGSKTPGKRTSITATSIPNNSGQFWTVETALNSVKHAREEYVKATKDARLVRVMKSTEDVRESLIQFYKKDSQLEAFVTFENQMYKNVSLYLKNERTVEEASAAAKSVIDSLMGVNVNLSRDHLDSVKSKHVAALATQPTESGSKNSTEIPSTCAGKDKAKETPPPNVIRIRLPTNPKNVAMDSAANQNKNKQKNVQGIAVVNVAVQQAQQSVAPGQMSTAEETRVETGVACVKVPVTVAIVSEGKAQESRGSKQLLSEVEKIATGQQRIDPGERKEPVTVETGVKPAKVPVTGAGKERVQQSSPSNEQETKEIDQETLAKTGAKNAEDPVTVEIGDKHAKAPGTGDDLAGKMKQQSTPSRKQKPKEVDQDSSSETNPITDELKDLSKILAEPFYSQGDPGNQSLVVDDKPQSALADKEKESATAKVDDDSANRGKDQSTEDESEGQGRRRSSKRRHRDSHKKRHRHSHKRHHRDSHKKSKKRRRSYDYESDESTHDERTSDESDSGDDSPARGHKVKKRKKHHHHQSSDDQEYSSGK